MTEITNLPPGMGWGVALLFGIIGTVKYAIDKWIEWGMKRDAMQFDTAKLTLQHQNDISELKAKTDRCEQDRDAAKILADQKIASMDEKIKSCEQDRDEIKKRLDHIEASLGWRKPPTFG